MIYEIRDDMLEPGLPRKDVSVPFAIIMRKYEGSTSLGSMLFRRANEVSDYIMIMKGLPC